MSKLIVFSGPPGVGKSTLSYRLARQTHFTLLTKDSIERSLEKSRVPLSLRPSSAYEILISSTKLNLKQSSSVILDAVFGTKLIQGEVKKLAVDLKTRFFVIECFCSNDEIWKTRVIARPEVVDGWTPADWKEVQRVKGYYQSWEVKRLRLDAVDPLEENYQKLVKFIGAPKSKNVLKSGEGYGK